MPTIERLRALHRDRKLNLLVDGIWCIALGAAGGTIAELLGVTVGHVLVAVGIGFSRFKEWILAPGRDGVLRVDKIMRAAKSGLEFLNEILGLWGLWETVREKMREVREQRARRKRR